MKRNKRRLSNEINAGSMADIAFLLLIFFLVTTTILTDKGITVKLPPWENDPPTNELPDRNVLSVKVNAENALLVEGELADVKQLKERTMEFIMNPNKSLQLPSKPTSAIISLQNDRGTDYETYIEVYNELKAAYNQLWREASFRQYGEAYVDLNKDQQKTIRAQIPLVISEAEPTDYARE